MKQWLLKQIIKVAYWLIFKKSTPLTEDYLIKLGWSYNNGFWTEPMVKGRDKIWVQFENHYYRVFHSEARTFISLESSKEWFQLYLFINDKHSELPSRNILTV